jgi:hypothetical protein
MLNFRISHLVTTGGKKVSKIFRLHNHAITIVSHELSLDHFTREDRGVRVEKSITLLVRC